MLKQNLNDKCYSMANIFSFAEKVIPDFKNKSEGEKFLFLYCITAKLLSNRLYDNGSAENKINCLLDRITKSKDKEDKKENVEQLKNLLETFVGGNDFSVEKVKSFFDTNKDLLNKIYENEKPADLLFFFAQMQSKNIFTRENNEAFVNGIEKSKVKQEDLLQHRKNCSTGWNEYSMYELNGHVVDVYKILDALKKDPNRIFNDYIDKLDKNMELEIFGITKDKYTTKGFKLTKRQGKIEPGKQIISENEEFIDAKLGIDQILKTRFGFKKIKEISKDELGKLNLNYDEEFIYFLASNDFSNEYAFQNSGRGWDPFYSFTMPENIKPEITLKIYDYFVKLEHQSLINTSIDYLQNKFETSQSLLDTYDKLNGSLNFEKDKLLNIFIGDPPKVKQILKCQDTKSPEDINKLLGQCEFQDIIDYFVDVDDNKNQNLLSKYMLENPEKLCKGLENIYRKLNDLKMNKNKDNNKNKLKKLQDLMKSFFSLKNVNELLNQCNFVDVIYYFLDNDECKKLLLGYMYSRVEKSCAQRTILELNFKNLWQVWKNLKQTKNKTQQENDKLKKLEYLITKFLLSNQDKVLDYDQEYIGYIIDMFEASEKFCMWDLKNNKEIDVTDKLKDLLNKLIDKNSGLVENKDNIIVTSKKDDEEKKDEQMIFEYNGKLYDLTKIYLRPSESALYKEYFEKNKYSRSDLVELHEEIECQKKILSSQAVSQETKQTVYFLAKKYKEYLQKTYDDFEKRTKSEFDKICNETLKLFLDDLKINQETYDRLKNANKNDVQEMKNRKTYLEKKANVTNFDYLKENWTTWLSFLLIIPIFLYIFIWKPEYENEINRLSNDLNNLPKVQEFENAKNKAQYDFYNGKEIELNIGNNVKIVAYKSSESGRYHKSMIDEMDKFINQYQKDFEPKGQEHDEEIPPTENENNIITDPDKNSP